MQHRRLSLILIAALALTASACGRSEPHPSPSPSPVSTSSPTPTVDASAEALYAEAERVYLAYQATRETYTTTGDYGEFPEATFAELVSPDYLIGVRQSFEVEKEGNWRLVGGRPDHTVEWVPTMSKDGSEIALLTCSDSRHLTVENPAGEQLPTRLMVGNYFLKHIDGALKISWSDVWEAETCPIK